VNKVYCRSCRKYINFVTEATCARFVEHPCCDCSNCKGSCCQSNKEIESPSRLPGWHRLHVHGVFCDGQDGGFSQCEKAKRKGPPDVITRLGEIK